MKRFILAIASILITISVFAHSFAGKTYQQTVSENGLKVTVTLKFLDSDTGELTSIATYRGEKEGGTISFTYEVDGIYIYILDEDGDTDRLIIGSGDTILVTNDNDDVVFTLKRVTGTGTNGGKRTPPARKPARRK